MAVNFEDDAGEDVIYPAIISDLRCKVLVDCGCPGFLPKLDESAFHAGISLRELTHVIITHHDYDHYGALFELKERYPAIRVIASETEAPYIEGLEKSLRLSRVEAIYDKLPPDKRADALRFQKSLEALKPVKVDIRVSDGAVFSWCGGVRIVASPGHMPGHISVLVPCHRTLITGDALVATNGRLRAANLNYAIDAREALSTAKKLMSPDIRTFVCYHGGVVNVGV
ncbi:MAG: MBL fold metallo-hydrolase [Synergistaceae bacterium]|nr:MBL fold metallo-hydrolase [Synergistaceae bacterium]